MRKPLNYLIIQNGKIFVDGMPLQRIGGQAWLNNTPLTIYNGQLLVDGVPLRLDALIWLDGVEWQKSGEDDAA